MSTDPIIQLTNVTKRYGARLILDRITLAVQPGETVALIGPSGGGKSTMLRCINALNEFDEGEIRVGPHPVPQRVRGGASRAAAREVRRLMGMIFQDFQLFPHLTALDNVIEAPIRVAGMKGADARSLGLKLLDRVGLSERTGHYPAQLSGGQKQRVAIARALAMSPRGLLCDEITSALDPELKTEVLDVLVGLKRERMTLVLVTHEIGFARKAADRVIVLADGRIIEDGPPEQVIDKPTSPRTQRFLRSVLG